jgi:hypothetical protein
MVNQDRVKELQPVFKREGNVVLNDGQTHSASRSFIQRLQAFLGPDL